MITNQAVTLRQVQPEDESFLAAVYGSTREQELAMTPWTAEQREAFIRFQFAAQLAHYRTEYPLAEHSVITLGEQPIGRIYIDRRESEIRILDITLLPRHRGQGIGTPIIRRVMDEAVRDSKNLSIELDSFEQSHQLFQRLGFKPTETTGFHTLFVWNPVVVAESGESSSLT
jgi:RimJ/RimL family protein N-acetyltransferase